MNSKWVKLTALTITATALIAAAPAVDNTRPDLTIAPCAWFESTHPIPANTATDMCVGTDGRLRWVPQA